MEDAPYPVIFTGGLPAIIGRRERPLSCPANERSQDAETVRAVVLMMITLPLTLTTGCPKKGEVTGHRAVCHAEGQQAEICDWQLRTTSQGETSDWFSVTKDTWDLCTIGESYPKCGDNR